MHMQTACNISKLALPMIACWLKWVWGHLNAVIAKWVLRSLLLFALQKETREVEPEMDEQSRRCAQCRCKVGISICNVCICTSQFGSVPYANNTTGVSTMTCTLVSTPGIWWYSGNLGIVVDTFKLHHTPMNTQVINQPIISETESLLKALYYHQGVSIANHTSSALLWKAHASPKCHGCGIHPIHPSRRYCGALCSALKKRTVILTCLQGIFGCVTWVNVSSIAWI